MPRIEEIGIGRLPVDEEDIAFIEKIEGDKKLYAVQITLSFIERETARELYEEIIEKIKQRLNETGLEPTFKDVFTEE